MGILCADGRVLSTAPVLRNCGVEDRSSDRHWGSRGTAGDAENPEVVLGHYNPYLLEQGLVELAKDMVNRDQDIGAMLLECSLFPTHARAVQEAVRLPVYDFSTLIDWVYSAVVRRSFPGYI